jgi:putative transposase
VADDVVRLNEYGIIVREEWFRSGEIRNEITLDGFIVMPNHFHGIIVIDHHVGADGVRPESAVRLENLGQTTAETRAHGNEGARRAPLRGPKSLGSFVARFKSAVTKRINHLRDNPGCPVWQRNYFERVIRDDRELAATREYIANNPVRWAMDKDNPANHGM